MSSPLRRPCGEGWPLAASCFPSLKPFSAPERELLIRAGGSGEFVTETSVPVPGMSAEMKSFLPGTCSWREQQVGNSEAPGFGLLEEQHSLGQAGHVADWCPRTGWGGAATAQRGQ